MNNLKDLKIPCSGGQYVVLELSFRDAVNTSMYALAKASLLSTALKDNSNTASQTEIVENFSI